MAVALTISAPQIVDTSITLILLVFIFGYI